MTTIRTRALAATIGTLLLAGCTSDRAAPDSGGAPPPARNAGADIRDSTARAAGMHNDAAAGHDPWESARQRGVTFRGVGQEPGWYVEITDGGGSLLFLDYGERTISFATPHAEQGGGTFLYRTRTAEHDIEVRIERRPCSDPMSGEPFDLAVVANVDGRTWEGCGRLLVPGV
jgi:uncharacterized membrane protein